MRSGFFYFQRRLNRRTFLRFAAFSAVVLLLTLTFRATVQMRPILESLAVTRVSNAINSIVSVAVEPLAVQDSGHHPETS